MRFFSFSIEGSNFDPGDLGNYGSQTKMSNTKVVYINFPYTLTPVPTLYDYYMKKNPRF